MAGGTEIANSAVDCVGGIVHLKCVEDSEKKDKGNKRIFILESSS